LQYVKYDICPQDAATVFVDISYISSDDKAQREVSSQNCVLASTNLTLHETADIWTIQKYTTRQTLFLVSEFPSRKLLNNSEQQ